MALPTLRRLPAVPWSIRTPVLLVIAAVLAFASVAFAAPKVVGIAAAVVNDVRIKSASSSQYSKAKVRQRVALADAVRTGARSRLQLLLLDKTKFTVGANAQLTIDKFVYDPSGGGSFSASVTKGAFRFMSGRSKGNDSSINSPSATIGIRGTLLDGIVGPGAIAIARRERAIGRDVESDPLSATLVVLRGPGPNTERGLTEGRVTVSAAGATVTLEKPLMAAYVPRTGAAPIGPFAISLPGLNQLNDLIIEPQEPLPRPDTSSALPFPEDDRPERSDYYPGAYPGAGPDRDPGFPGDPAIPGFPGIGNGADLPTMDPGQVPARTGTTTATPANPTGGQRPTPTTRPTGQPTGTPTSQPTGSPTQPTGTPNNPQRPIP